MKKAMEVTLESFVMGITMSVVIWGVNYLFYKETVLTNAEMFVSRVDGILGHYEYTVDKETGNEEIAVYYPFSHALHISYSAECVCVTSVYDTSNRYSVSLLGEKPGDRIYYIGRISKKVLPYESFRQDFEAALAVRNTYREKISKYIN